MSLQRRLTLYFVLIVMLPLVAAAFGVQQVVGGELERRAGLSLRPALDSAVSAYNSRLEILEPELRSRVMNPAFSRVLERGDKVELREQLDHVLEGTEALDAIVVLDPDGTVRTAAAHPAELLPGYRPPRASDIASAPQTEGDGFIKTSPIPLRIQGRGFQGHVVGATWIDGTLLQQPVEDDVSLSLAIGNTVVASTLPLNGVVNVTIPASGRFVADFDEGSIAEAQGLGANMSLVASTPEAPLESVSRRLLLPILGVLVLALIVTSVLALLLARHLTQPLEELAAGAIAIAEGRFDHSIPVRSRDEVGRLAMAFNEMRDRLSQTYSQLSSSRDQLQRAVRRVGETLRSTHDMNQMFESIVNTAADAVDADAAILWRFNPTRSALHQSLALGTKEEDVTAIGVGEGVVGFVAERALPMLLPSQGGPRAARNEPAFPVTIAVPIYSEDRVTAILAVYRSDDNKEFSPQDLETAVFLAEQGGVAIENVLLHEEAQRLSLSDGLTGTWNRRYFQMQFRQVLATATRFNRPFSFLMLDLDHFKVLNDTHGHQRGDAVLIEFSRRVKDNLREVDTFARYGGEEFIVLLPETNQVGAQTTAEKIREAIRSQPFASQGEEPVRVTASIGVASYPAHGESFHALVEAADKALYAAKQAGRDRVMVAGRPQPPDLKVAR